MKPSIIEQIITKQLPLAEEEIKLIRFGIQLNTNLTILDGILPKLRQDWLDTSLDPIERATKNITVKSDVWRAVLKVECNKSVHYYIQHYTSNKDKIMAILLWRAGLAYLHSLSFHNIRIYHTRVKRDEKTLRIHTLMPITYEDMGDICNGGYTHVMIPDVMLGTGNSASTAIDILKKMGIEEKKISILCIVACPEGVFRLLSQYPEIHIITNSLDGNLNQDGYIVNQGLGDAGDKFFYENSISMFEPFVQYFSAEQWQYLTKLLKIKNE